MNPSNPHVSGAAAARAPEANKPDARPSPRRARRLAMALVAGLPLPALAQNSSDWAVGSGNWSSAGNWSNGVPSDGFQANIINNDATNRTITYDDTVDARILGALTLDNTGAGTNVLSQASNVVDAGIETIGAGGRGSWAQSGGGNYTSVSLILGNNAAGSGSYALMGGTFGGSAASAWYVGYNGGGSFTQSGGTASPGNLYVGTFVNSSGSYALGRGSLTAGSESVGAQGHGTFTQNGGANQVNGDLNLAVGTSSFFGPSMGSYTLGAGPLTVTGTENIGLSGNGAFTQTGGAHAVTGSGGLSLGTNGNSGGMPIAAGAYSLSNGSLSVTASEAIGNLGSGTFTQTGGTHTVGGNLSFAAALAAGSYRSSGSYNLGSGALSVAGDEIIGGAGDGTFTQGGGSHVVTNNLTLGRASGATGSYLLGSGALTVAVDASIPNEYVGDAGTGSFIQTGGTHTVGADSGGGPAAGLILGNSAAGHGSYALSNGSLFVYGAEHIGSAGSGAFTQTGGTHQVVGSVYLGSDTSGAPPASAGSYDLSGGSFNSFNAEFVGFAGNGGFVQSGGAHTTFALYLAYDAGSTGSYSLSNGTLAASNVIVGGTGAAPGGAGTFTVSGGSLTTPNTLKVWNTSAGAVVTRLNLSGGTITLPGLDLSGDASRLNWTAGALQFTGDLALGPGFTPTSPFGPSFALSGSQNLSVAGNETIGVNGAAAFTQSGGAHAVGGTLSVGSGANAGAFNLSGGSLSATAVQLNTGGAFNQTGGSLYAGTFNQTGGTVTGTLQVQGVFNYTGGTFAGRLLNQGTVNLGAAFTAGNGMENDTTCTVAAGQTLTLNGAGLDNPGTFFLAGGTLAGNGTQTNDYGGIFYARGNLNAAFANRGNLVLNGVLTATGAMTNTGVIQVGPTQALRQAGLANAGSLVLDNGGVSGTGSITNNPGGIILGNGGISSPLTNNGGIIEATINGPLRLDQFTGGNVNGGQIKVLDGATISVLTPFPNDGVIVLMGSSAVLAGPAVTNTGTLRGSGQVSNPVLNAGVIRPEGGRLDLSAAGNTNAPAGQIQIDYLNTAFFIQGLAANAGTIALSGGTFDNNNRTLNNTGTLAGNGVVRTGGLTNNGLLSFADANSQVYGPVTNNATLNILSNTTTFFGPVTNAAGGTIKTTAAVARFLGGISVGGTYSSDPSDNYFTDLTVAPTGSLTGGAGDRFFVTGNFINNSTQSASFDVRGAELHFTGGGTHQYSVASPGAAFGWGTVVVDPGDTLVRSGNTSGGNTANNGTAQFASGSTTLGALSGSGATTVGTLSGAPAASLSVTSFDQSRVTINPGSTLSVLPGPRVTNTAAGLSIAAGGRLDLNGHDLLVDGTATPEATLRQYLANGYNGGAWDGPGGITSSAAAAGGGVTALGYAGGAVAGVPANGLLVRYTVAGDTTLKGSVNFGDAQNVLGNFGRSGAGWTEGDFNYDGKVAFGDFQTVLGNFGQSVPAFAATGASALPARAAPAPAATRHGAVGPTPLRSGSSLLTAAPATAPGATVTLTVVVGGGTWSAFATDSAADGNKGIASFDIDLIAGPGTTLTLTGSRNRSPQGNNADQGTSDGFNTLRNNGNAATLAGAIEVHAAQSVGYGNANDPALDGLVFQGVGQTAGAQDGATWAAPVLLASGAYTGSGLITADVDPSGKIQVLLAGPGGGPWQGPGNVATATVLSSAVPEPTGPSLLALGAAGLLCRRRRGRPGRVAENLRTPRAVLPLL